MKTYYDSFVLCKSNHNTYIIPHTVMKSRYTNVKYHCEISWYFSVPCLPQSLRNYKEEAKIKPSKKALAMPGQWLGHIWYVTAIHNVSVVYIHIHLYIYVQRERLLREAIMVKFCDIIWCHQATMNQNVGTDLKSKTKYTGFVKIFIYVNSYLKSQPVWNTIYRHIDSRICHIRVHIAKYD